MSEIIKIEIRLPNGHWAGDSSRKCPSSNLQIVETMPLSKGRGTAQISTDSKLLALTPISAFRPRRWRGALLSEKSIIKINVLNFEDRQASVTADNIEFRNIKEVTIESSQDKICKILFDNNHSIEDKILNEQFEY